MPNYRVYVCHNYHCKSRGAPAIWQALRQELRACDAEENAQLIVAGCLGRCDHGPNLMIHPGATKYSSVTPTDVPEIVSKHLVDGQIVDELVFREW